MVKVLFLHPDLGIGGAERLVVDAALALQSKGHDVSFLTNHHDENHCFEETNNGTLKVQTVGDWLPRNIFGRFFALCAYIKIIYASFYTAFCLSKREKIDVIFCDQISAGIPILRFAHNRPKILFYCHFPDQLLSKKGSTFKHIYRKVINYVEEKTTGQADGILVNSKFTRGIFKDTFNSLKIIPEVLYPSLNTKSFDAANIVDEKLVDLPENSFIFLSINRFERKKNIQLAIKAFQLLENSLTQKEWDTTYLIIAGGYDKRLLENVEHFEELRTISSDLKLSNKIIYLQSPSNNAKIWLLKNCNTLLYTPAEEHFGIVPLEGMYMAKPIIAVNSGGPTETIVHDETGLLCDSTHESFSNAMKKLVKDPKLCERMGEMGRKRVQQKFSFDSFTEQLDVIINELTSKKDK